MKIIISPAKTMRVESEFFGDVGRPVFLSRARELTGYLSGLQKENLKKLLRANDKITELNYNRYQAMDVETGRSPALLSYVGLQYQSMAPWVFTDDEWRYVRRYLYILSGLYGILGACDGIVPYRLEMQAKLALGECKNLYEYWKDALCRELLRDDSVILNLASKEYSRAIEPYLPGNARMVSVTFGELSGGKVVVKGTKAKMARGTMVRWLAKHQVTKTEKIRSFHEGGYNYQEELSDETHYVFIKNGTCRSDRD